MKPQPQSEIEQLLEVMAKLRDPDGGCPWDLEQDFATIAPHTIEEAYEVADAIENGTPDTIKDELGDLLFQVVFYAQMARERDWWSFNDIAAHVAEKMIRRHPHVFGNETIADAEAMTGRWEADKAVERAKMAAEQGRSPSALDGVIAGLPALTRALKLQKRAARVGFDWGEAAPILDKIEEEVGELRAEMTAGSSQSRLQDELGDLLFAVVNLARRLEVDPDTALRQANTKFERRFRAVEERLAANGTAAEEASLAVMESHWEAAKQNE
ncbi:MAG: nucleoside triphosphate pyrophosphohydrolase [Pseudomonadota bacterium]